MDARALFLADHSRIHAAATSTAAELSAAGSFTMQDDTLKRLEEADLRASPDGLCSIVWHLWHLTRIEDVVVNAMLRGAPEILDRGTDGRWLARPTRRRRPPGRHRRHRRRGPRLLRARRRRCPARLPRRRRPRDPRLGPGADLDALDAVPDLAARLAAAPPIVGERARWLPRFYTGKSGAFLLTFPVTNHGFMHWAEARVTRGRLGHRNP